MNLTASTIINENNLIFKRILIYLQASEQTNIVEALLCNKRGTHCDVISIKILLCPK